MLCPLHRTSSLITSQRVYAKVSALDEDTRGGTSNEDEEQKQAI